MRAQEQASPAQMTSIGIGLGIAGFIQLTQYASAIAHGVLVGIE